MLLKYRAIHDRWPWCVCPYAYTKLHSHCTVMAGHNKLNCQSSLWWYWKYGKSPGYRVYGDPENIICNLSDLIKWVSDPHTEYLVVDFKGKVQFTWHFHWFIHLIVLSIDPGIYVQGSDLFKSPQLTRKQWKQKGALLMVKMVWPNHLKWSQ